jgi:hypothetical protein
MAIYLKAENTNRISWFLHPLRRMWTNHNAKVIARSVMDKKRNVVLVEDLVKDHFLGRSAAYLRSVGVTEIAKNGLLGALYCKAENGYLMALSVERAERQDNDNLALFQLAVHPEDMAGPRQFAGIGLGEDGSLLRTDIEHLFPKRTDVTAYNMSPTTAYDAQYVGPGRIVLATNHHDVLRNEGELSVLHRVAPFRETGREPFDDTMRELYPNIIIKDETRPTTPLGLAAGGFMGAINFGAKRLYHLVLENARFLLANLATNDFTVFLGKSNRYIKFFGVPLVGTRTLKEFTAAEEKQSQFIFLTRPLDLETAESQPKSLALVDKATGRVKYVYPPIARSKCAIDLMKRLSAKLGAGAAGRLNTDGFDTNEIAKLEQNGTLTADEAAELKEFAGMASQPDISTDWSLREVIPGAFIMRKDWLDRLNQKFEELDHKFSQKSAGKSMARVLREEGGRYTIENMVHLAMTSSDGGKFVAGYVGKHSKLAGKIDPGYLRAVYDTVRDEIFQKDAKKYGNKMYAANVGESSQVISFSDEAAVNAKGETVSIDKGENNYLKILRATVDFSWKKAEEWEFWRRVLDIPTSRLVVNNSYVGAWRIYDPKSWFGRHLLRRNQVIIDSSLSSNVSVQGPCYIVGSSLTANQPLTLRNPVFSVFSRAQLGSRVMRSSPAARLALYNFSNTGPLTGDDAVESAGLHFSYVQQTILPGSGKSLRVESKRVTDSENGVISGKEALDARKALHDKPFKPDSAVIRTGLDPDGTAIYEEEVIAQNLFDLDNHGSADRGRFFGRRRRS